MATVPTGPEIFQFAGFEFDPRGGVLHRGGKPVRLQPQPARILALLISRAGELITRDEITKQVWGETTFVDFEHNLNFSVRQIRTALHDDAEKPRFIETLPRRGYRFIAPVHQVVPGAAEAIESLAVLPLENLSHDPEEEYFADGITDELITELAKIGSLRVISRTSVRRYKRIRKSLPEIARQLNVDAVVEGTVLRSSNRVRITAQLIRAKKEEHLWAESYDRDLGDVLKLQAEVTRAIASQVHIRLTANEEARLKAAARHIDPAAHESYLRGRYFWNKRTEEDLQKAQIYFQQAIDKEPTYAVAYSGLADTYLYRGYTFGRMDPKRAMPIARAAASRALELDPNLAEAHTSLGLLKMAFEWDFPGAARALETALRLNPNYATAHHVYAALLAITGRVEAAIEEAQRALQLDPLSVPINNIVAEIYMFAGRLEEAIAQCHKAVELEPNIALVHENLGTALEQTGQHDEALAEYLKALGFWGESAELVAEFRSAYECSGWRGFREKRLQVALARHGGWHFETFHIATLYAGIGDNEQALTWLEEACAARSGGMIWIKSFPYFRDLYSNPRFQRIVRQVGLPS